MKMIIAGGGTGGHLFPGVAIAEEFLARDRNNSVLFIGTERGLEKRVLGELGYPLRILDIEGIKGRSFGNVLTALAKIPKSLLEAAGIINEFRPDIVIGVGGYASGPAVLMAYLKGIKTAIAEQNAFPGLTNRILGNFAHRIFLSFAESAKWFSEKRVLVTGNPIRAAFRTERGSDIKKKEEGTFTVLVFGGSQGARAINRAVMDCLEHIKDMKDKIRFIHQTGSQDAATVADGYGRHGIKAEVTTFIVDMAAAYQSSDILICRAGATSIAEITASGKAAVLIPFPYAVNDHQTKNAEVLVRAGAARMIPESGLDGRIMAETIQELCRQPEAVRSMEKASALLGNSNAASDIVNACMELTGRI